MDEKDLIKRIIEKTRKNDLVWFRNKSRNGIVFNCRYIIDGKKKLILKAYLLNEYNKSFFEIKMNNGLPIHRFELIQMKEVYNLLSYLEYKVR